MPLYMGGIAERSRFTNSKEEYHEMTSIRDLYSSRRKTMTRVEMVAAAADRHNVTEGEVTLLAAWKDTSNNTLHYSVGGPAEYVVLYDTVIAARTGTSWRIDTGGFNTATTRDRLNTFTPFNFHTDKGVLHINGRPMHHTAVAHSDALGWRGFKITTPGVDRFTTDRALVEKFIRHGKTVGVPSAADSGGDPWLTSGRVVDADTAREWLEAGYWTRALVFNAHRYAGETDSGAADFLRMADRDGYVHARSIRAVRKYMRAALDCT